MRKFVLLLTLNCFTIISFSQTVNKTILDSIVNQSQKTNADALIIYKDNKLVHKNYFNKPVQKIEAMSASKSVVSIGIGLLLDKGFIKSIDDSVSNYYPEWRQGNKKYITIRHLLNHTSGLQNVPNAGVEIEVAPDVIQLALCAELDALPGSTFSYNNKASNLLTGIVKKASGLDFDQFLSKYLFKEMGITDFFWRKDKAGNPLGMAGLNIYPEDFAKLGQLILNNGKWNGKQLLSEDWIKQMVMPFEEKGNYGFEWWVMYERQSMEIDDAMLNELKPKMDSTTFQLMQKLKGKYENGMADIRAKAMSVYTPDELQKVGKALATVSPSQFKMVNEGKITGYVASGYLGQFLIIIPEKNIVVVKMISSDSYKKVPNNSDFSQIRALAYQL
jgi:CubicO group peptidase (beta-lactamase class C family)